MNFGKFPTFVDQRGSLTVWDRLTPFEVKRVFWIYDVPEEETRASHAHASSEQMLFAVQGSLLALVNDQVYELNDPSRGLYIPPGAYLRLSHFLPGTVCLVLCSDHYEADEMIKPFLDLTPSPSLQDELDEAYLRVMYSGRYVGGQEVEVFEQEWAEYCQTQFCIGTGSGLGALEAILRALNIGPGDEVIVPSWTATPTWQAVLNVGATIVPVDSGTFLMQPESVESVITSATKAIIPVHLYGALADTKKLSEFGIPLIEDACQAHGARGIGQHSVAAAFSFYPTKNLGAYGDAGAIVTNHFMWSKKFKHQNSSRLDPLQAAFLRVKLKYLDEENERRRINAKIYRQMLAEFLIPPQQDVYHQFVICFDWRNDLRQHLEDCGIETLIHYPRPPHWELDLNFDLPRAEQLTRTVLSLPITWSVEETKRVVAKINEWIDQDE